MRIDKRELYSEVHFLALHYHWSEKDILSMTRDRRKMYVELLKEEIEQYNMIVT